MKMLTLKLKPKMIFGIVLAVTGVLVIILTFVSNHMVAVSYTHLTLPTKA